MQVWFGEQRGWGRGAMCGLVVGLLVAGCGRSALHTPEELARDPAPGVDMGTSATDMSVVGTPDQPMTPASPFSPQAVGQPRVGQEPCPNLACVEPLVLPRQAERDRAVVDWAVDGDVLYTRSATFFRINDVSGAVGVLERRLRERGVVATRFEGGLGLVKYGQFVLSLGYRALEVFDVSNLEHPRHAGAYVFGERARPEGAFRVYVSEARAYVLIGTEVLVLDLSAPASPKLVSSLSLREPAEEMVVHEGRAYILSDGDVVVWSLFNGRWSARPLGSDRPIERMGVSGGQLVTTTAGRDGTVVALYRAGVIPELMDTITVDGARCGAGTIEADPDDPGIVLMRCRDQLAIITRDDRGVPERVQLRESFGFRSEVQVSGGLVHVVVRGGFPTSGPFGGASAGYGRLTGTLGEVFHVELEERVAIADSVVSKDGVIYIGDGPLGVHAIDMTDPAAPVSLGRVADHDGPLLVSGDLLLTPNRVLDISDPRRPVPREGQAGLAIVGDRLARMASSTQLVSFDGGTVFAVANTALGDRGAVRRHRDVFGGCSVRGCVEGMVKAMSGQMLYAADVFRDDGPGGEAERVVLRSLDLVSGAERELVGLDARVVAMRARGGFVFALTERSLYAIDAGEGDAAPRVLARLELELGQERVESPSQMAQDGRLLLITRGGRSVVFDVSDPSAPVQRCAYESGLGEDVQDATITGNIVFSVGRSLLSWTALGCQ